MRAPHGGHFEVRNYGAAAAEANFLQRVLRICRADGRKAELREAVGGEIDEISFVTENADWKVFSSHCDDWFFFDCEHAAV